MTLVAYKDLPTFERLRQEGWSVLSPKRAQSQEIRELHVGLLNMMPDGALQVTERQFFKLIGESNRIAQFYVHPFTLPALERGAEAQAYIDEYYESFEDLQCDGLDALIITGANVSDPDLTKAAFWEPLQDVMEWAWENVTSTLCSCLATHAVMQFQYGQTRTPLPHKRWGVYKHHATERMHPLMRGVNTVFNAPHSRHNEITRAQFADAGLKVLSVDADDHVHIAVSKDGIRQLLFQGHPEYEMLSLYKEYQREVTRFVDGEREDYPPCPENFMNDDVQRLMHAVRQSAESGEPGWPCDDDEMRQKLENSWADTARSLIGNWIGLVYQLTHVERAKPFMDGVDPNDPLKAL